jgi:hypothetical protein
VNGWEQWAPDAESFERACLSELETEFSRPGSAEEMRWPAGREIRGARLDGSHPTTAIVVAFLNLSTGKVEEWRYPLWEGDSFRAGDIKLDPGSIAQDIYLMLSEP